MTKVSILNVDELAARVRETTAVRDAQQDDDTSLFSSDDESTGSIFSSDDDETVPKTLKDLQDEFKARDELLERLAEGIDQEFVCMMRSNEQAARAQKLQHLNLIPHGCKDTNTLVTTDTSLSLHASSSDETTGSIIDVTINNNTSLVEQDERINAKRAFIFYSKSTLGGIIILLLNCVAFNGFEQLIRSLAVLLSRNEEFEDLHLLPCILFGVGIVLEILTGGIWDYVRDDIFQIIKFDMKNRLLLGKWDAMLEKWFRRHEVVERSIVRPFAYFTCVYVVCIFQDQVMSWAFGISRQLIQDLPSAKHGVVTPVAEKLLLALGEDVDDQRALADATCLATETCSLIELQGILALQDEAYVASRIAADSYEDLMGDTTTTLVTETVLFWYYFVSTIVAIITLRLLGHKFWSV